MLFCSHAVETTVETGLDLATSVNSKVSGFERPHVFEKASGERVEKFSDMQVGFTGYVWTKGIFGKKSFKSIRIRVDGPSGCLHFALGQRSDFNGYDVASGSEVLNVMAEKKEKRALKQKGLAKG